MCWLQAGRTLHDPPATHGHGHRPRGKRSNTHHMRPPATWEMEMIPDGALSAHTGQQHNGHMGGSRGEGWRWGVREGSPAALHSRLFLAPLRWVLR